MKKCIFYLTIILISSFLVINVQLAFGGSATENFNKSVDDTAKKIGIVDEESKSKSFEVIIGQFVNTLLNFLGVVFFLLTIYGGIIWMTAAGNETRVVKAKSIIIHSIIGLAVILLSRVIAEFVIDILAQ